MTARRQGVTGARERGKQRTREPESERTRETESWTTKGQNIQRPGNPGAKNNGGPETEGPGRQGHGKPTTMGDKTPLTPDTQNTGRTEVKTSRALVDGLSGDREKVRAGHPESLENGSRETWMSVGPGFEAAGSQGMQRYGDPEIQRTRPRAVQCGCHAERTVPGGHRGRHPQLPNTTDGTSKSWKPRARDPGRSGHRMPNPGPPHVSETGRTAARMSLGGRCDAGAPEIPDDERGGG